MSQLLNIDEIQDGMVLAEPVTNKFGNVLLPAGAELKSKHKNLLKTWNVSSLYIKSDDIEEEIELTEEMIAKAKEIIEERMLWKPRNDLERDLLSLFVTDVAKSF